MILRRAQAIPVFLAASILAMTAGPLLAAQSHDLCDAAHHGCASISAIASCCCNGSDANVSRVPAGRTDAAISPQALPTLAVAVAMPAMTIAFVREGSPDLRPPPDRSILFGDLRL
jgi:hypothetical protein